MHFRTALRLTAACLILIAATAQAQQAKPNAIVVIDRIIAVVNDEVITERELAARVDFALRQLAQQGTQPPARQILEKQLLERTINDRVQMQYARDTGTRVDNAELDRAMVKVAEQNKMTVAELRTVLAKDNVPYDKFREDNVSHILIAVPEKASPEQLQARRERAEQALAQIKGGTDFRQVAAAFSDGPEALQGGLIGWRETSRLPALFLDAVRPLQAGQLTELLRSPNGFHILRLNERRGGAAPIVVQQTRARHILVKTNELISETEARNRILALKDRLDNKVDFAELARTRSEDTSASRGGDLNWLSPGDTVPEFERAMDELKPGEISGPVRSPFGWHLIQVMERRNQDMTQEGQRMNARQTLRERKTDEAYQEWVRQLRDRAYVEQRLENRS